MVSRCCHILNAISDTFVAIDVKMNNTSVKENISRIRQASGISQTEMAEKLGISRTAYRNIEKGETVLISENVDRIAAVLDKTPEEIVLGYRPSERDSARFYDIQKEYSDKEREIIGKYESDISGLKEQIHTLKEYVTALKEIISTKEEIISMLKRKVAGEI